MWNYIELLISQNESTSQNALLILVQLHDKLYIPFEGLRTVLQVSKLAWILHQV